MWRFAVRNLCSRPVRSSLSLLGLTVAIAGMVVLFAVAQGLDDTVNRTFNIIPGIVALQPGAPIPLFSRLPREWGDEISTIPGVHQVCGEVWDRANIVEGRQVIAPPRFLLGTDIPGRQKMNYAVYREHVVEGRFLNDTDLGTNHTVLSRLIADDYGKKLGDTINVDGEDLEIVGIYHSGSLVLDVAILLDVGRVREMTRIDRDYVSNFYIEPDQGVDPKELADRIEQHFVGRTHSAPVAPIVTLLTFSRLGWSWTPFTSLWEQLLPGQPNKKAEGSAAAKTPQPAISRSGLEVRSAEDWADQFQKLSADLDIFLLLLTSVGVTIAVLSIVNTMLMSVTERMIEFGILKANGWTNRNVLTLISLESAGLGLSGGLLGSASGWIVVQFVNARWYDRVHLYASPGLLLFGVLFSTTLGILGGLYPAIWASRMVPMDAIRRG